jgi:hypothetical protein
MMKISRKTSLVSDNAIPKRDREMRSFTSQNVYNAFVSKQQQI